MEQEGISTPFQLVYSVHKQTHSFTQIRIRPFLSLPFSLDPITTNELLKSSRSKHIINSNVSPANKWIKGPRYEHCVISPQYLTLKMADRVHTPSPGFVNGGTDTIRYQLNCDNLSKIAVNVCSSISPPAADTDSFHSPWNCLTADCADFASSESIFHFNADNVAMSRTT